MDKEWYMIEYEEKQYLHHKTLEVKEFQGSGAEHRHCELCWAIFSSYSEDLHCGYYEKDSRSWICESCYKDFKDLFQWTTGEKTGDGSAS